MLQPSCLTRSLLSTLADTTGRIRDVLQPGTRSHGVHAGSKCSAPACSLTPFSKSMMLHPNPANQPRPPCRSFPRIRLRVHAVSPLLTILPSSFASDRKDWRSAGEKARGWRGRRCLVRDPDPFATPHDVRSHPHHAGGRFQLIRHLLTITSQLPSCLVASCYCLCTPGPSFR